MIDDHTQEKLPQKLTRRALKNVFVKGEKHSLEKGMGIERECFLYKKDTKRRLDYNAIENLLKDYVTQDQSYAITPVYEQGHIIGATLMAPKVHDQFSSLYQGNSPNRYRQTALSLEPGGQFEIATRVHHNLHDAYAELCHVDEILAQLCERYGFFRKDMGFEPTWAQKDLSWMPKGRYKIMRDYMPHVGTHGLDMMRRTCTLQINLDYENEQNMADMMFVAHALTPLAGALFAASPFYEGSMSPYKSYRHYVWQHTDKKRSGLIPAAFNIHNGRPSMRYDDYVEYLLSVPMYFIYRNGYQDYAGKSFLDFMNGEFFEDVGIATLDDFYDHMTVAFPEVRLKTFLEMRCIDASPVAFSASAFFVGLLYSSTSLQSSIDYIVHDLCWDYETVRRQYHDFPKKGLGDGEWEVAKTFLDLAKKGLKHRSLGEEKYLEDLAHIIDTKTTYSDILMQSFSAI